MLNALKNKTYNFLRYTQKYTGTDNVYLARGGFWLGLGQVLSTASIFALSIAFANLLPKETYGLYQYALSVGSILAIFALPGIGVAIVQSTARGYEGSLISAVKTKIKWGMIGSLSSFGLATYYYIREDVTLSISFSIVALFLPFVNSFDVYGYFLRGKKLFNISTRYGVLSQIVSMLIVAATLFLTKNIFLILLSYFASRSLLRFIFLKRTLKKIPPNKKIDPETIPYGKYLSFTGALGSIANHIDKILLWHLLGPANLAIYALAIIPVEQAKGLIRILKPLALPKLSQRSVGELKKTLPKKIFRLFPFIIIVIISYILIAPIFYKTFYPQYLSSVIYSQIFSLSILYIPASILATALIAKMKRKEIALIHFAYPIFKIGLLLILAPLYGIIGVILALLAAEAFHASLAFILFKRMDAKIEKI